MLETFDLPGNDVVVPCAGTAPMAVAAELVSEEYDVTCIDMEEGAREAYERRRADELDRQETLNVF